MKTRLAIAVAALSVTAASAYADVSQLAASVGVDPAGYTTTELARMKRNAETGRDEQVTVVAVSAAGEATGRSQLIAAAGLTPAQATSLSLNELARAKTNREARRDNVQPIVSGRSLSTGGAAWAQFAASAGVDADAARGMTIHEIYLEKISKESSDD